MKRSPLKTCTHPTCDTVCRRPKLESITRRGTEKILPQPKSSNAELQRWFTERRREMTGKCMHCGGKSCKNDDSYFKFSVAHLLPKAYFASVATHPLNWIELCFWGKSCHTNFDNLTLDITELNCYNEVIERFIAMYPSIDPKERRRIPMALMNYVDIP